MKRTIILFALIITAIMSAYPALADDTARDALVAYSGTEAFTKLTPEQRQACTAWLVSGGIMDKECRKAVIRLIAEAPDAVTPGQREALLREASMENAHVASAQKTPAPVQESPSQKIEKDDDTGKIIAAGILGIIAGMVIHNNVRHRSAPSYQPAPPPPPHHVQPPHPAPNFRSGPPAQFRQTPQPVRIPERRMPPNHGGNPDGMRPPQHGGNPRGMRPPQR
ncbi:MAG: hypothetical protein IJQ58_03840 [Synergistaceae bacterium]|nr:hypothetical protein [Synergistaceae bacterium]